MHEPSGARRLHPLRGRAAGAARRRAEREAPPPATSARLSAAHAPSSPLSSALRAAARLRLRGHGGGLCGDGAGSGASFFSSRSRAGIGRAGVRAGPEPEGGAVPALRIPGAAARSRHLHLPRGTGERPGEAGGAGRRAPPGGGAVTRCSPQLLLPAMRKKAAATADGSDGDVVREHWLVRDMFSFENVGFTRDVGNVKFLVCADCEAGPIGWHCVDDKDSFYVALERVAHE